MEFSEIDNSQDVEAADAVAVVLPPEVGYCLKCGYDMRGLGVQKCPECGTVFDAEVARAFTVKWAWDLRQRLRIGNVVSAIGCMIALLYLLTGIQIVFAAIALIGLGFLLYYVLGLLYSLYCLIRTPTDSNEREFDRRNARVGVRHCSIAGLVAAGIVGSARSIMAGGIVGAFAPAAIGLGLLLWQIRTYTMGRDRCYLLYLPESFSESIRFAVAVSKFFAFVTFALVAALLAVR